MDKAVISNAIFTRIQKDNITKKQALLYLDLVQEKISLDSYFILQGEIDKSLLKESQEANWEDFKINTPNEYTHEKEHFNIWKKYGITSKLYRWNLNGEPFVIDVDFMDVSKSMNHDNRIVIKILKEMFIAPYKNLNDSITACQIDIFFFEILDKNILNLELESIKSAFSKYFIC